MLKKHATITSHIFEEKMTRKNAQYKVKWRKQMKNNNDHLWMVQLWAPLYIFKNFWNEQKLLL